LPGSTARSPRRPIDSAIPQLVNYARSTFRIVGLIVLAKAPVHHRVFFAIFTVASLVVGILSCLAGRTLRRKGPFARPLVAIGSVGNLIYFPFGTIAGIIGLAWCFSDRIRSAELLSIELDHKAAAGDGTHSWLQKAALPLMIVVLVGSLLTVDGWGHAHALSS